MRQTKVETTTLAEIEVGDRFREELGDLTSLKKSITEDGLIHNLAVVAQPDADKPYKLLAGERRYVALLELEEANGEPYIIPVNVYEKDTLDPIQMRIIELAENLIRQDMHFVEETKLKNEIHKLHVAKYGEKVSTKPDAEGWSLQDTANLLGEDQSKTSRDIIVAKALDVMPELGKAKGKTEAYKILQRMRKKAKISNIAAAAEKKIAATPMDEIKKFIIDGYTLGDALATMKGLISGSFGLVEIDPPYAIDLPKKKREYDNAYKGDLYDEIRPEAYEDFMRPLLAEAHRILRHDGWLIQWFGPDPWFALMLTWMKDAGFKVRGMPCIWTKGTGQVLRPELYLASSYEMFFYGSKKDGTIVNRGRSNIFNYKTVTASKKSHPTERPIEMMVDIIQTFTIPDISIFVPCCGSGNTMLAGANLRMDARGVDLNETYRRSFIAKVEGSEPPHYSSYIQPTVSERDPIQ